MMRPHFEASLFCVKIYLIAKDSMEVEFMDDLERMAKESEKFSHSNLEKKKNKLQNEVKNYEFKTMLDAVELLFELRAKREKSIKDQNLIAIIEGVLSEQPFEYPDEDFILSSYKESFIDSCGR